MNYDDFAGSLLKERKRHNDKVGWNVPIGCLITVVQLVNRFGREIESNQTTDAMRMLCDTIIEFLDQTEMPATAQFLRDEHDHFEKVSTKG